MVLKTGDLRNYVTIQVGTRTSDGQGGWTVAWTDTYEEWMKATPLSMSKVLDQGGIKYRLAVEFISRYRHDHDTDFYTLSGEHRIIWNEQTFTIHSVVPDETMEYLKILAYV
jgi:SPP1 family predicted phage head-tail adaptor